MASGGFSLFMVPILAGVLWLKFSYSFVIPLTPATQRRVPFKISQLSYRKPRHHLPIFTTNGSEDSETDDEEFRYQEWRRKQDEIEKKLRLQISSDNESEADSDVNSTFDFATEMDKVVYIDPGLPADSPEQKLDEHVSQSEGEMYNAVKKFDMKKAEKIRDEISQSHIDDCGAVLQVNSAFYDAFEKKDYPSMERVWLHDATSLCIHPSQKPLVGAHAVLESWKSMFESTVGDFQQSWMVPSNIRLVVRGCTAIVTCDEDVYSRRFVRGKKRETELINKLRATNIFRKVSGQWYIVYHHASWHENSNAAKAALTGDSSGGNNKSKTSNKPSAISGIMGTQDFGPFLGDTGRQGQNQGEGGSIKKIIMGKGGSISDLFGDGGPLSDILSGGEGGENGINVIRLGGLSQNEEDDDEEEDDEEEEIIHDLDTFHALLQGTSSGEDKRKNAVVGKSKSSSNVLSDDGKKDEEKVAESGAPAGPQPKDSLRQSCILALRKLYDKGNISQKQKRVLLTDIITCSARGEYSMVEVAYELLCGCEAEDGQDDIAEEEFADQCRVFSQSLPQT